LKILFFVTWLRIVCVLGVYQLTGTAGTLACTLTLTVRKFLSLVISILYFNNPFTEFHWMGGVLVFVGTAVYSMAPKIKPEIKKE
jgi:UDP-xylose/UDP-N-acetylglucosamine transporter B4